MTTYLMNHIEDDIKIYFTDGNNMIATIEKSDNLGLKVTQDGKRVFIIPWTSILKVQQLPGK